MAIELKQSLKLSQQLLMTPQLQQAIKILQLPRVDFESYIVEQLAENPCLEEESSEGVAPRTEATFGQGAVYPQQPGEGFEAFYSKQRTLTDTLLEQVSEVGFAPEEKKIAADIIGNLDSRGYFDENAGQHYDSEVFEGVLDTLQRFEPVGVCARSLKECLLIQLREYRLCNGVVEKIIEKHLEDVEKQNIKKIAKSLGVDADGVLANISIIRGLEPNPARSYGEGETHYIVPDVYVYKFGGEWVVSVNEEDLPRLKVSEYYKQVSLKEGDGKAYLGDKVRSAVWLLRSIEQRQRTIYKVARCIVEKQVRFFEKGVDALEPLVLRDVAEEVGMHESTVSRVTSNKYMHTPRGVLRLKYFFGSGLMQEDGSEISAEAIKRKLKDMIAGENKAKPWSDAKLVDMLMASGVKVARRTVAKYREQLGIGASSRRRQMG